jgi:DNA invertase Pin-like site-specific DNA recombinase
MKVGYARVSSYGQSLDVQLEKLKDCDKVFSEKITGTNDKREQLQSALDFVRDGDEFVITKLDRCSRSVRDLLNILHRLESKNVSLRVLDQSIDTSTPTGRLMISVIGSIAQFENDLRKERQTDGILMAKSRGVHFGRNNKLTNEQIQEMKQKREEGLLIKDLMFSYGLSKSSVYRLMLSLIHI